MTSSITTSAWSPKADPGAVFKELTEQIGEATPAAILFFAPPDHDGATLSRLLADRYHCPVTGCTTAGEISDHSVEERGVTVLALGTDKVSKAASAPIDFTGDIGDAVRHAVQSLATQLAIDVRNASSERYVGIVLIDGLSQHEEEVNHALGTAAPGLMFVGGSAGDDLRFGKTRVFLDGHGTTEGAVLLLLEVSVPIAVVKSYSAESTGHRFLVTRADEKSRTVYEVDHKPVLPAYAAAVGVTPSDLKLEIFMRYPWALVDGQDAWLRSAKGTTADGGLQFLCSIREGMSLTIMRQMPIIEETRRSFDEAAERCGGTVGAAIIFNCAYRRIELDRDHLHRQYATLYENFPTAGFHTYGESLIAHINQTCTALFLGA